MRKRSWRFLVGLTSSGEDRRLIGAGGELRGGLMRSRLRGVACEGHVRWAAGRQAGMLLGGGDQRRLQVGKSTIR